MKIEDRIDVNEGNSDIDGFYEYGVEHIGKKMESMIITYECSVGGTGR